MNRAMLPVFFGIAFLLNWGLWAVAIFTPQITNQPYFYVVGGCAPTIAALFVVLWIYGPQGLGRFLARLLRWNIGIWWYLGLIALFVGMDLCVRTVTYLTGGAGAVPAIDYSLSMALPLALLNLVATTGPLGEEFGWRGLALPLMQRRHSPQAAGLILGCIWGAWHIPAFLFAGKINLFPLYFLYLVCGAILMTAAYNATGGSLPLMIIVHGLLDLNQTMNINYFSTLGVFFMCAVMLAAAFIIFYRKPGAKFSEPLVI